MVASERVGKLHSILPFVDFVLCVMIALVKSMVARIIVKRTTKQRMCFQVQLAPFTAPFLKVALSAATQVNEWCWSSNEQWLLCDFHAVVDCHNSSNVARASMPLPPLERTIHTMAAQPLFLCLSDTLAG